MSKNTFARDKKIYKGFIAGDSIETLSGVFGLKPNTIKKIIKSCENLYEEKEEFLLNASDYIRVNYSALRSSSIVMSLRNYANDNNIISKEELIDTIKNNDIHIRGIGEKSKLILNEYLTHLESTK